METRSSKREVKAGHLYCWVCKKEKLKDEFYRNFASVERGYAYECKRCHKIKEAKRRQQIRERVAVVKWVGKKHKDVGIYLRDPVPQTVPGRIIDPYGDLKQRGHGLK